LKTQLIFESAPGFQRRIRIPKLHPGVEEAPGF
jgi:hypothetical protein